MLDESQGLVQHLRVKKPAPPMKEITTQYTETKLEGGRQQKARIQSNHPNQVSWNSISHDIPGICGKFEGIFTKKYLFYQF